MVFQNKIPKINQKQYIQEVNIFNYTTFNDVNQIF